MRSRAAASADASAARIRLTSTPLAVGVAIGIELRKKFFFVNCLCCRIVLRVLLKIRGGDTLHLGERPNERNKLLSIPRLTKEVGCIIDKSEDGDFGKAG